MSILDQIKSSNNVEERSNDYVVGTSDFSPLPSGLYKARIEMAYIKPSAGGALGVTIILQVFRAEGEPRKVSQTFYITNKKGENFYTSNGKQYHMMGYSQVNDICLLLTNKSLTELKTEDKNVEVFNYSTMSNEIEILPVLTDILGKDVGVCLVQKRTNKTQKQGDKYVPIAAERIFNEIDKVLLIKSGNAFTHTEISKGLDEPEFINNWLKKWDGELRDDYQEVGQQGANSTSTTPPWEGGGTTATSSKLDIG